jgi:hypothetical protein
MRPDGRRFARTVYLKERIVVVFLVGRLYERRECGGVFRIDYDSGLNFGLGLRCVSRFFNSLRTSSFLTPYLLSMTWRRRLDWWLG